MADVGLTIIVALYALSFFGLAAVLLVTSFRVRAARIFAMLLVLRGVANVLGYAGLVDPPNADLYAGLFGYALIVLAPAALYFAAVFPRPRPWARAALVRVAVFLVPTVLLLALYAVDHDLFRDGPLSAAAAFYHVAYALVALVFVRDLDAEPSATGRRSLLLVATGFAVVSAFDLGTGLTEIALRPASIRGPGMLVSIALTAALVVATAAAAARRRHVALAATLAGVALVGVVVAATGRAVDAATLVSRLVLPVLVTYGLLRTRVFGLDLSVRWTVARGTLAGAFVAAFFVAAQLAESFLQTRYDWLAGGLAAGLLLFALAPLQRAAQRIADRAVPGAKPVTSMSDVEREAFYQDLLRAAWVDGTLTREERRVLETARVRLGIPLERAHALESETAA